MPGSNTTSTGQIADLSGLLWRPGQPALTLDEITDGIADAAAASGLSGLRSE